MCVNDSSYTVSIHAFQIMLTLVLLVHGAGLAEGGVSEASCPYQGHHCKLVSIAGTTVQILTEAREQNATQGFFPGRSANLTFVVAPANRTDEGLLTIELNQTPSILWETGPRVISVPKQGAEAVTLTIPFHISPDVRPGMVTLPFSLYAANETFESFLGIEVSEPALIPSITGQAPREVGAISLLLLVLTCAATAKIPRRRD